VTAWVVDGLVLLGLVVMTLGVYGVVRFPDVYTQLHASSKAAFLGVSALLVAVALGGDGQSIARVVLIVVMLALTTPVAAHAIGQAAYHRREPMRTPGAVDESGALPRPGRDGEPPADGGGPRPVR
jgi:multicomponent Na+:H+ antiporter subunit G